MPREKERARIIIIVIKYLNIKDDGFSQAEDKSFLICGLNAQFNEYSTYKILEKKKMIEEVNCPIVLCKFIKNYLKSKQDFSY